MAKAGEEPIGSMGNDGALAVLSDRQPPLFNYFKQLFAQVTNPPIDPIRESIVMSLATGVGSESNLLDETPQHAHQLVMDQPILRNDELETLRHVSSDIFRAHTIDITWPVEDGPEGMTGRLALVCDEAHDAVTAGVNVLILSDRRTGPGPRRRSRRCSPSPPCTTTSCAWATASAPGLVLESGEPREVHHFATLIGYGASAINPYLLFDTVDELVAEGRVPGVDGRRASPRRTSSRRSARAC